jgi:3-methyladenine DNA glycosylase AlkD
VKDDVLGVGYAALGAIVKRAGVDHDLALSHWSTGVHEARVVGTKVADPARLTRAAVERWLKEARDYVTTDALSGLAARADEALSWARLWIGSRQELTSAGGWNVIGLLAREGRLPAPVARALLERIERGIRHAPNRTRHSMNGALISIGGSLPELTAAALATARRTSPVVVDHGQTGCRTPDACAYIKKMRARKVPARTRVTGAGLRSRPRR